MKNLANGINLHVISTEKYKTIRLLVRFTNRHRHTQASARTLLTSLLETSSQRYPNQNALSTRLAELYGASFGINVNKKGNLHQINASMNVVNGRYVGDEQLFFEAVAFLEEILLHPKIQDGRFDESVFTLEKDNMLAYLDSISEDKQTYASLQLQDLYFQQDPDQRTPSFGTYEETKTLTATGLVETYQQMLQEDQIDIFVVGDIQEATVEQAFAQWQLPAGERVHPEIFYRQVDRQVIAEKILREDVQQAKLNLAYRQPVYFDDLRRPALMVFNGLFGGFPHSKLFMNVREKASLAYYASSSYDTFRGLVTVQTGIDGENREKVLHLINLQLESLRQGNFTPEELQQTKTMLINQFQLSLDNPAALMETAFLNAWLPATKRSEAAFIASINEVTKEQVAAVAREIHLEAVFFLSGGKAK